MIKNLSLKMIKEIFEKDAFLEGSFPAGSTPRFLQVNNSVFATKGTETVVIIVIK